MAQRNKQQRKAGMQGVPLAGSSSRTGPEDPRHRRGAQAEMEVEQRFESDDFAVDGEQRVALKSKSLGAFTVPTSDLAVGAGSGVNDYNRVTNVKDPTAAQDAATKAYVDARTGIVKLGSYNLDAKASSFEIAGWFDDAYEAYEFHCEMFTPDDDSGGMYVLAQLADSGGTYRTGSSDVKWVDLAYTTGVASNSRMAVVAPLSDDAYTEINRHNFKLWLPNNRSGFGDNKMIISEGWGQIGTTGSTIAHYSIANFFMYNTGTVTKLRFRATDSPTDTSFTGDLRANARVIVYGRTF